MITMTQPRTRLGRQIDDALNEMGIPVFQARTTQRVAYPNAINEGNSVVVGRDQGSVPSIGVKARHPR